MSVIWVCDSNKTETSTFWPKLTLNCGCWEKEQQGQQSLHCSYTDKERLVHTLAGRKSVCDDPNRSSVTVFTCVFACVVLTALQNNPGSVHCLQGASPLVHHYTGDSKNTHRTGDHIFCNGDQQVSGVNYCLNVVLRHLWSKRHIWRIYDTRVNDCWGSGVCTLYCTTEYWQEFDRYISRFNILWYIAI